jgi:mycothiol synthase
LEPFWSNAPGKYHYGYSVLPEFEEQAEVHTCVYDFVLAQLAERQPTRLSTGTREDRSHRVAWLEANGFVPKMRIAESELDITNFDFSRFNGAQERVAAAGVEMLTLAELRDKDPRWMEKLYDMLWEIEQDVPHVDPPKREPFDQFVKGFDDPDFWPEGWQMAIDPAAAGDDGIGAYVGVSMLGKNQALPQRIQTWLTGVVRSHRRKGIALAMKLRAIESAIQQGGTAIRTDNEENNPMLGINKVLGFVEIPAGVNYEKEL